MFLDYGPCTSESFRFSVSGLVPGLWFCVEGGGPPRWLSGKESICNGGGTVGDANSIPRSWRSPGGGNGNPLQHSCLGNPMERGAWRATKGYTGLQRVGHSLRTHTHTHTHTHSSYFFNPPVKLSEVFCFTKILQIHHLFLRYLVLAIMKNLLFYFFIVRKDFCVCMFLVCFSTIIGWFSWFLAGWHLKMTDSFLATSNLSL